MYPLVRNADNGRGFAHVRASSTWEISVPFSHFCREPKTSVKKEKVFKYIHIHTYTHIQIYSFYELLPKAKLI